MEQNNELSMLPQVIKDLMGSPAMAEIMKSMTPAAAEAEKKAEPPTLLTPDMAEKLPQVIAALREAGIGAQGREPPLKEDAAADAAQLAAKLPQAMSVLSGAMGRGSVDSKNRKALLSALKPYMNERKRSAIDTMLSVDSMAEIMQLMMGGEK